MNSRQKVTSAFKDYAVSKNYIWANGHNFFVNQKQNEGSSPSSDETFLFLFDFKGSFLKVNDLEISGSSFTVDFFIGKKGLVGEDYSESNKGIKNGLYKLDRVLEPVFTEMELLIQNLHFCDGLDISNAPWLERVNWGDLNLDGYLVTVNLTVV